MSKRSLEIKRILREARKLRHRQNPPDKIQKWVERVDKNGKPKLTPFLIPARLIQTEEVL